MYPIISNLIYNHNQTIAIAKYTDYVENADKDSIKELYKQYNDEISKNMVSSIDLMSINQILGYIEIPKINVNLQIYEGTSVDTLSKGVGHLENTSLPGQNNTNCVLAGHSGLSKAKMFDELDKLEVGDVFYVTILDEKFCYKVDQIKVVEKDNVKDLKITKNCEYVTLVTCTPKFINSHRLLVRGERVQFV